MFSTLSIILCFHLVLVKLIELRALQLIPIRDKRRLVIFFRFLLLKWKSSSFDFPQSSIVELIHTFFDSSFTSKRILKFLIKIPTYIRFE